MFTDAEFAAVSRIPAEDVRSMDEEISEFAAFTIRIPTEKGMTDLWSTHPTRVGKKKELAEKDRQDELTRREEERQANLAKYIEQGFAFEKEGEENDED